MNRRLLLRIAATLSLLTCLAHTIGIFLPVPAEQLQMHATIALMKTTMVPLPLGYLRSFMEILDGNNLCTSVLLALCGSLLFAVAGAPKERVVDRVVAVVTVGLVGMSLLCFRYFFAAPALTTGLAAVLAAIARSRDA